MIDGQQLAPSERVLDLIKKLNAKAESAAQIGSAAEAEAFAAKVTDLLLQYNLSMDDLPASECREDTVDKELFDPEDFGVKAKRSRVQWQETLAVEVAQANFCRILVQPGRNSVSFIGRRHNREVAMWLYATLVGDLETAADRSYVRYFRQCYDEGDPTKARGYRAAWLTGAVSAIVNRLRTDRQHALTQPKIEGLMRRTELELNAFIERYPRATGLSSPRLSSAHGFSDGQAYGNAVGLDSEAIRRRRRGQASLPSPDLPASTKAFDQRLAEIYSKALSSAGIQATSRREGVAFNLRAKGFSITEALNTAARRLGENPTQFAIYNGTLYLSTGSEISSNPWLHHSSTSGGTV